MSIIVCSVGWAASAGPALIMPFISLNPTWRYFDDPEGWERSSGPGCEGDFVSGGAWSWIGESNSINADLTAGLDTPCSAGVHQSAAASSAFFFGVFLGSPLLSALADRFGRKPMLFGTLLAQMAAHGALAFSGSFQTFAMWRAVAGFFGGGSGIMCFVYPTEVVGKQFREKVMLLTALGWVSGAVALALVASLVRGWRALSFVTALPGVFFLLGPLHYMTESPAFHVARGEVATATACLELIARRNGVLEDARGRLQSWEIAGIQECERQSAEKGNEGCVALAQDLARALPRRLAIMCSVWMCTAMIYYAISLGVGSLGSSVYVTAVLAALVEIPASFSVTWMVGSPRLGRQRSLLVTMSATVACCILASQVDGAFRTVLALAGKLSVSATFSVVYLYGSELFPASIRSSAMGLQSTFARIGAIAAPEMLLLDHPMLLIGLVGAVSIPGILLLPETLGRSSPTTLADVAGEDVLTLSQAFGYDELVEEAEVSKRNSKGANALGPVIMGRVVSGSNIDKAGVDRVGKEERELEEGI